MKNRITEIETLFGVNLREPNRKKIRVYMKAIILSEFPKVGLSEAADAFDVNHATIYHYRLKMKDNSEDCLYKAVQASIAANDKSILERYERPKRRGEARMPKKEPLKIKRTHLPTRAVFSALRKDPRHYLWGKAIPSWTDNDWAALDELNQL